MEQLAPTLAFRSDVDESGIAVVTFDTPGTYRNLCSAAALRELDTLLSNLQADPKVTGVVFASAKSDFTFGADLSDIASLGDAASATCGSQAMQSVFARVMDLGKPTAIAVHGTCVGAGVELATSCRFRVASHSISTRFSLPEIRLGFFPGAGGTWRLPRLIGVLPALDMMLGGKFVSARSGLRMGLVDKLVEPGQLLAEAKASLFTHRRASPWKARLSFALFRSSVLARWLLRRFVFRKMGPLVLKHYPAYEKTVDVVLNGLSLDRSTAFLQEAEAFGKLVAGEVSQNLIRLFLAVKALRKSELSRTSRLKFGEQEISQVLLLGGNGEDQQLIPLCLKAGIAFTPSFSEPETLSTVDFAFVFGCLPSSEWEPYLERAPEAVFLSWNPQWSGGFHRSGRVVECRMSPNGRLIEVACPKSVEDWVKGRLQDFGKLLSLSVLFTEGASFLVDKLETSFVSELGRLKAQGNSEARIDKALLETGFLHGPFAWRNQTGGRVLSIEPAEGSPAGEATTPMAEIQERCLRSLGVPLPGAPEGLGAVVAVVGFDFPPFLFSNPLIFRPETSNGT